MAVICEEARRHAAHCEACGQFTTAEIIRGLCDWIDIQQSTISQHRKQFAEMEEELGFKRKFKGGANHGPRGGEQ